MTVQNNSETAAQNAQTAMMLEVCCKIKPGNVDRGHDYEDTSLEHFLQSVIHSYNALCDAAESKYPAGTLIYNAVRDTNVHKGGNTHFGAFLLLVPLLAGRSLTGACEYVKKTTVEDAVMFYKAFGLTCVRMNKTDDMDVNSPEAEKMLREKKMTLYDVMKYSSENDMVAREWINGFRLTREFASALLKSGHGKDAIPFIFMDFLSRYEDTFIVKKLGHKTAELVMKKAADVIGGCITPEELDRECLDKGINPGSLADIAIAGIYTAISEGWDWDKMELDL